MHKIRAIARNNVRQEILEIYGHKTAPLTPQKPHLLIQNYPPFPQEGDARLWSDSSRPILGLANHQKQSRIAPANPRQWLLPGELGGIEVLAFPDSGSNTDIISEAFAIRHGLAITPLEPFPKQKLRLPDNKTVTARGIVALDFQFHGETHKHTRNFAVLRNCVHDVILGSSFLKLTETFTHFKHRLIETTVSAARKLRLCLNGVQRHRMRGFVNGRRAYAIPDTGADVMLMSRQYAESHSLLIRKERRDRVRLELADGSEVQTCGRVRNCTWEFASGGAHKVDFHVYDRLPYDIILSNEFLFDNDVFLKHEDDIFDEELTGDGESYELSLIRLLGMLESLSDKLRAVVGKEKSVDPFIVAAEARAADIRRELQRMEQHGPHAAPTPMTHVSGPPASSDPPPAT